MSKLRHYVPKRVLLQFYSSNIKPIIQYGLLIYGCVSVTSLQPLVLLQKNSQAHFVPEKHRNCNTVFEKYKVLTAHELHIYELLKFVIKSVNTQIHILMSYFLSNPDQTIPQEDR